MSKISQSVNKYVNIHRQSRTRFMSIADFNKQYNANLPVNKVAEAAFHSDLRRKRRMMFPVRSSALYPIARDLELGPPSAKPKSSKFSIRPRRQKSKKPFSCNECKAVEPCDCKENAAAAPIRRVGMKLSNISISRPKAIEKRSHAAPVSLNVSTKIHSAPAGLNNHKGKQREGNKHPKGRGHERRSHGGRRAVESSSVTLEATDNHGTFNTQDAKVFYQKINPEFLKSHNIEDVVSAWNKAPLGDLLQSIRSKYGQAPKDMWTMKDVKSFYQHYDPEFLGQNNLHKVMNDWVAVEPAMLKSLLTERYGSCPGEPFKKVNWTPAIVTKYYNEVFPAKLQQETPQEIIQGWNKYSVEEVMSACKGRYGVAPQPVDYVEPVAESHVELYKRQLEDSGSHFDATKIIHFVPTNSKFADFSSHAAKFKSSAARFLIDGIKGPYKMYNGDYKTFQSINSEDVKTVMRAVKQNKSGNFFIRVEE